MERRQKNGRLISALAGAVFPALLIVGIYALALKTNAFQAPEPDMPIGAVTVNGNHVVVHALPVELANAKYLANLGDAALET